MTFITAREIFNPYFNDELGNFGPYTSYKIYCENNFVGEFLYKNIVSSFATPGGWFCIVSKDQLLKRKKYSLIERNTGEQVGQFQFSFWRQLINDEIGRIHLKDQSFICTHSKPSVSKSSFFSSESDASITFSFKGGEIAISYWAKYKILNTGETDNYKPYRECTIEISMANNDILFMYLGLFFIERFFSSR